MVTWEIRQGDALERLRELDERSIDAVVTDPPYGIGFMGHAWDQPGAHQALAADGGQVPMYNGKRRRTHHKGTGLSTRASDNGAFDAGRYDLSAPANQRFQAWCEEWARECLRVLKPGGHMAVFGGTRTYHRLVSGVEDAGFEIRDQLAWLFGSGFPKSRNVGRALADEHRHPGDFRHREAEAWKGHGTALKPAHELVVVARKPLAGTVAQNVLEHGTGALNVDGCRIGTTKRVPGGIARKPTRVVYGTYGIETGDESGHDPNVGRWPANVVLDDKAAPMLDEQTGGASRFFYCAKASRAERNAGLDGFEERLTAGVWGGTEHDLSDGKKPTIPRANLHPTVKPIELMRWLVRLVTPPGGTVLDPFTGSGTTGCAAVLEGLDFIGIEREGEYARIAEARIGWWERHRGTGEAAEILAAGTERDRLAADGQLDLLVGRGRCA